ncbi:MAG: DUF3822 family protein [Bacteroidales bacterium]|nr:DUF3822 family protein [Bacteroidales bacterium]
MPDINLVEKSITQQKLNQKYLSIQVDLNGFSFFILDTEHLLFLAFRKYSFQNVHLVEDLTSKIEDLLEKDDLLQQNYNRTGVIFSSQKSTLVPSAYFNEKDLRSYFEFNHSIDELDEIHYNYIYAIDAYNVFTIPNYVANELYNKFQKVHFYHQATPIINGIYTREKSSKENEVYINLNKDFFDIAVICSGSLNLYNTFSYQDENDLLYFILYVCKQLSIESEKTAVYLSGEECSHSVYFAAIKKYLPYIFYNIPNSKFIFAKALDHFKKHTFINLINLYSCEL